MALDPDIWGPHYWFVLHTISLTYPTNPNDVTKKKYYDFIQNIPLFLPSQTIGNKFSKYLDMYPVTPYLDSRESFIKWVNFIHNKVNISIGKEELTLTDSMTKYYENYKPKEIIMRENIKNKQQIIFATLLVILTITIIYLYKK